MIIDLKFHAVKLFAFLLVCVELTLFHEFDYTSIIRFGLDSLNEFLGESVGQSSRLSRGGLEDAHKESLSQSLKTMR